MTIEKNIILLAQGKRSILKDIYFKETKTDKPVVVFCHGYKGFKDWGAWDLVAKYFANAGFCFIKFNFSHNGGTIGNPIDFPDLDAFANNNYSRELDDLDRVISSIDASEIYLIGHSRGGGIVLIHAEEDPRIKKVITWAGVSDYKVRFQEGSDDFNAWKTSGITYVENSRTKQQLPHNWQFYEDFKANEHRLTIHRAVKALTKPQLIVHGDGDATVGMAEARALHSWNTQSKLINIDEGDHVFGASHPWESDELPTDLEEVIKHSIQFLKK